MTASCRKCGSQGMRRYGKQGRRYCPSCRGRRYQRNGHTEKFRSYRREWQLKNRYGITQAEFDQLSQAQSGLCAICSQPPTSTQKGEALHVDHSHDTRAIRGLLCNPYNVGLSNFKDDAKLLRAAADYLDTAPEVICRAFLTTKDASR